MATAISAVFIVSAASEASLSPVMGRLLRPARQALPDHDRVGFGRRRRHAAVATACPGAGGRHCAGRVLVRHLLGTGRRCSAHPTVSAGRRVGILGSRTSPGTRPGDRAAVGGTLARATTDAVPYLLLAGCCLANTRRGTKRMKLLVANRGEIAVRIFRTRKVPASRLSPSRRPTIARPSTHGSPMRSWRSLPDAAEHVRAAQETGADAIHPGYGFLAESAELAEAVEGAGLIFVGPSPRRCNEGGEELAAKEIARQALVRPRPSRTASPRMSASRSSSRRPRAAADAACASFGPPKTVAEEALAAARREAKAAFGDDCVLRRAARRRPMPCPDPAAGHGGAGGRTSAMRAGLIQRRHQKVLEESDPSRSTKGYGRR